MIDTQQHILDNIGNTDEWLTKARKEAATGDMERAGLYVASAIQSASTASYWISSLLVDARNDAKAYGGGK